MEQERVPLRIRLAAGRRELLPADASVLELPLGRRRLDAVYGGVALHLHVRRLRAREAELEELVDERTRDLARSQAETEPALATVEAQAAELRSLAEARSRFFANVSHELEASADGTGLGAASPRGRRTVTRMPGLAGSSGRT